MKRWDLGLKASHLKSEMQNIEFENYLFQWDNLKKKKQQKSYRIVWGGEKIR